MSEDAGFKWRGYNSIPPGVACSAATPRTPRDGPPFGLTTDRPGVPGRAAGFPLRPLTG